MPIMLKSTTLPVFIILSFCSFTMTEFSLLGKERVLYDFKNQKQQQTWFQLNDDIMGGVSSGKFSFSDDHILNFSGKLYKPDTPNTKESKFPLHLKRWGIK